MSIWEVSLIGVALAMDAVAVGFTDGMAEPRMPARKQLFIALLFGAFQGLMPLLGYYFGSAFSSLIGKIAPWLAFAILTLLGGKALLPAKKADLPRRRGKTGLGALFAQAVATSIDALAVGVSLLAAEEADGLPMPIPLCALIIAVVTFVLAAAAVCAGLSAGRGRADGAERIGGAILIVVGLKILLGGVL